MKNLTGHKNVSSLLLALTAVVLGTTFLQAQNQHCGCPQLQVVYCGKDGMSFRCGPGTSNHRIGYLHHGAYVTPTGDSHWCGGVLWQKVRVEGWLPIGCGCNSYLSQRCHNQWVVTHHCPLTMSNAHGCRVARMNKGTVVHGNYQRNGKLFASSTGWVAVRSSSGKVYLR